MRIVITEKGFCWESASGNSAPAAELWGPFGLCRYEQLTLVRSGTEIDHATIQHIGTHASYDGFAGLESVTGRYYQQTLKVSDFEIGDTLLIKTLPDGIAEATYWRGLTGLM